jgi:small-conductance mechanosensitive channel
MYPWVAFLHITGIFLFLMAHGISAGVAFQVRKERQLDRLRALLDFSGASYKLMYSGLLLLLLTGVINGFIGHWWSSGWIWVSLVLLTLIIVAMVFMGSRNFTRVRKAIGAAYMEGNKMHEPGEPASSEEIEAAILAVNPLALAAVGVGGILIVAWLMMFKPF